MKLKEECIGHIMTVRAVNGQPTTVTIQDNPKLFKYYSTLGLDIFEEIKKPKREPAKSPNK